MIKRGVTAFFRYARERQQILLNRRAGLPREQWTKDPILQKYRFCNVFREDDKTTTWFREHVRSKVPEESVLLATVVFRMFNRIDTGEAIFCDDDLLGGHSAFDEFLRTGKLTNMRRAIVRRLGKGPYVTGAYIISSPPGYSKLDGVLEVLRRFYHDKREWKGLGSGVYDTMGWGGEEAGATELLSVNPGLFTLEATWNWLRKFDYLGVFHSYEVVTDLRHTPLLDQAPDIMTWASPGPGARRGLNRVHGRDVRDHSVNRAGLIEEMRELLWIANHMNQRDENLWPADWQRWEMRDVEHTLCEFDKYSRVKNGEGRPRGVYR
jgi:hypothetical protein